MQVIKNKAPFVARVLLGSVLLVFGLNGFLGFLPTPAPSGDAATFLGGLAAAGYLFPLLKITEIAAGIALLSNRFVPLALIVLAPITINILGFHLALAPAGTGLAILMVGLQVSLAWHHRDAFRTVLAPRAGEATHKQPATQAI